MSYNLTFSITYGDILYAAVLAFFVTWLLRSFIRFVRMFKTPINEFGYTAKDIKQILQRCYKLFPVDVINFHGVTYKRGMRIKIITMQKKIFEGEFIGLNEKDMVCILTKKYIIAHEINNIEEIQIIDKPTI